LDRFTVPGSRLYNSNELGSYRSLTNLEIQAEWSKVEAAQQHYHSAAAQYNRVLEDILSPDCHIAVRIAGNKETTALMEYISLLQSFSRLVPRV
jgi:hypothetical protein